MLITTFPAGPWQTNCYVLSREESGACVIIDPGVGAFEALVDLCLERSLEPQGIIATHGHVDHVYSVADVCRNFGVPLWIHPDDAHLLTDPLKGVGPMARDILMQLRGSTTLEAPDDVRWLADGGSVEVAGIDFALAHAPGHTQGCVLLETPFEREGVAVDRLVFTGDVVFAGSIGRTDLPGADHGQMLESLRTKVLPIADSAVLLPGHGPQTSMAHERATNPYLKDLA